MGISAVPKNGIEAALCTAARNNSQSQVGCWGSLRVVVLPFHTEPLEAKLRAGVELLGPGSRHRIPMVAWFEFLGLVFKEHVRVAKVLDAEPPLVPWTVHACFPLSLLCFFRQVHDALGPCSGSSSQGL